MGSGRNFISYRPDIDGLRAVAVLTVILFHAGMPGMKGGFVGVDIFLVISGYLITSILLEDQSLVRFYQRRARRILPALFVLLIFVLIVALKLLLPHDLERLAKSMIATVFFGSNIFFWRQSDYFAIATELWPLLHTWSLGVEEQFYIIFPILIRVIRGLNRRWIAFLFGAVALLSFAAGIIGMEHVKTTLVFYLAPTRAWELLVGSILATNVIPTSAPRQWRGAVAMAGIAGIVLPTICYSPLTPFPGIGALPPVFGAAAIIWAGTGGPTLASRALSLKPVIFVGLISYSLYLWHWPMLAFARYYSVDALKPWQAILTVMMAFFAAAASWRFVERPFRRRSISDRSVWLLSLAGIMLTASVSYSILQARGLPQRFPARLVALNEDSGDTWRCPLTSFVRFGSFYACPLNLPDGNPRLADIVLWGDSHAQMYVPALETRRVLLVNANGCAPVMGDAASLNCGTIQRSNFETIKASPTKIVILAQNWPQYRDEAGVRLGRDPLPAERYQDALRRLRQVVKGLNANGKTVFIVGPLPIPGYDVASSLPRRLLFRRPITQPLVMARSAYNAEMTNILRTLEYLERKGLSRTIRVDRALCDKSRCPYVVGGHAVYADYSHFATAAAARLRPVFDAALKAGSSPP